MTPAADAKPRIVSVATDQDASRVGGFLSLPAGPGVLRVKVEAENAERVVFLIYPTGTETYSLARPIGEDRDGSDGWTLDWAYQDVAIHDHILIRAEAGTEKAETTIGVHHEPPASGNANPGSTGMAITVGSLTLFRPSETLAARTGAVRVVPGLPNYTRVVGWLGEGRVLAIAGSNPIALSTVTGEYQALNHDVWSVTASPDGKLMAYRDEQGLTVARATAADWGKQVVVVARASGNGDGTRPADIGEVWWSPDSSRLLISEPGPEFPAGYWVYDISRGSFRKLDIHLDGYLPPDPIGWVSDDEILFSQAAMRSQQGETAYREAGYRRDLTLLRLTDNTYRQLTHEPDGSFLYGRQSVPGMALVSRHVKDAAAVRGYIFLPGSAELRELPAGMPYSLSPDGQRAIVLTPPNPTYEEGNRLAQAVLVKTADMSQTQLGDLRYSDWLTVVWEPSGTRVVISASIFVQGGTGAYRTWVLDGLTAN